MRLKLKVVICVGAVMLQLMSVALGGAQEIHISYPGLTGDPRHCGSPEKRVF